MVFNSRVDETQLVVAMTLEEALAVMTASLTTWASRYDLCLAWSAGHEEAYSAVIEFVHSDLLLVFVWERMEQTVFTTFYRTSERGPDDPHQRMMWEFSLPRIELHEVEQKRTNWLQDRTKGTNSADRLAKELEQVTRRIDSSATAILAGDWGDVHLHGPK